MPTSKTNMAVLIDTNLLVAAAIPVQLNVAQQRASQHFLCQPLLALRVRKTQNTSVEYNHCVGKLLENNRHERH